MAGKGHDCMPLKEWYPNSPDKHVDLDIVAIPGLGTDPYWTWAAVAEDRKPGLWNWLTRRSDGGDPDLDEVIWLRDLLPSVVKNARILAFGYQSNYFMDAPKRTIDNLAEELLICLRDVRSSEEETSRPLVFVCHCFGGIILKEALILATLDRKNFGQLRNSTRGIVFLGTPHRGTSVAAYGEMIISITKAAGLAPNNHIVSRLRENSSELWKLAEYFSCIYSDFDLFCFYELKPWKFGSLIVDEYSAVIERQSRSSMGLDTDHSGLNKYRYRDDPNFVKVATVISRMAKAAVLPRGQEPASTKPARSWETAVALASEIDVLFSKAIAQTYISSNDDLKVFLKSLVLANCRFRAWAHTVGIFDFMGELRRPLHRLLDGLGCTICSVLDQIQGLLNTQEDCSGRHKEMQSLVTCLLVLLPEVDREASNQLARTNLSTSLLDPDNTFEDFLSTEDVCRREELPDLEVLAAMRRIQFLMEKSELSGTEDDGFLSVDINALQFESKPVQNSTESRGLLAGEGGFLIPILIEWKKYAGIWDTEIGNVLFSRTVALTRFLRTGSHQSSLRILECLGYCHHPDIQRIGLIFKLPPSTNHTVKHVTLHSYISRQLQRPALGDRFELSRLLAQAVLELHIATWLHKSFSSERIIFFPESEMRTEDNCEELSLLSPYILGFNYTRPDRPTDFSEPGSTAGQLWYYRHPAYKKTPLSKYTRICDYYSLGIVLLEIGLWETIQALVKKLKLNRTREEDLPRALIKKACPHLAGAMGTPYQSAVAACLESNFGETGEESDDGRRMQLMRFQEKVLEPLAGYCVRNA